jgi:RNA polymerase sigma-70 factor (ECF subfamily)
MSRITSITEARKQRQAAARPAKELNVEPTPIAASNEVSPSSSNWVADLMADVRRDPAYEPQTAVDPSGVNPDEAEEEAKRQELALVNRAIAGDKVAFTELYDKYHDQMYRYVLYRVSSLEDAEDINQLVFLQAWRAIGRYHITGSPFVAWLFTIAHNLVVSFYRRNRSTVPLDQEFEESRPGSHPEFATETILDQERTRVAISKLRPDHQKVINQRFMENRPHRDIANSMGKTEGAVRVIQHRALVELRRILEREEAA